jgi:hypothetical protein
MVSDSSVGVCIVGIAVRVGFNGWDLGMGILEVARVALPWPEDLGYHFNLK